MACSPTRDSEIDAYCAPPQRVRTSNASPRAKTRRLQLEPQLRGYRPGARLPGLPAFRNALAACKTLASPASQAEREPEPGAHARSAHTRALCSLSYMLSPKHTRRLCSQRHNGAAQQTSAARDIMGLPSNSVSMDISSH